MLELDGIAADSLVDMIKLSFSWENWAAVIEVSDKLFEVIAITYDTSQNIIGMSPKPQLKRSIVYYFGYSLLMKGVGYQKTGQYAESRKCINQYKDLSWIKNLDDAGIAEVNFYKSMAMANGYVIELLEGNSRVLQEYVRFLQTLTKKELLNGMLTVLESAIKYNYSIDWVLDLFEDQIEEISSKEKREDVRSYVDYKYLLATYLYRRNNITDALNGILEILQICSKLEDEAGFRKSVAFYELIRNRASDSQQEMYQGIIKNILEREFLYDEEDILVADNAVVH
ncbi:hypothetical protein [Paenibacillus sp. FSL R7-0331]|uniref:hypothetical protein n=1 Tax=Paenibacillus sp. FSL R7-0331 TaxID=1536773 RepID=UPI0004F786CD|nr:hypothetical protein [Paenibacillus sp. FSL R7-0331]AIQ50656.1 hypothetical protein R70331_03280 [Paenibacillus sp. FSL R7-0331]